MSDLTPPSRESGYTPVQHGFFTQVMPHLSHQELLVYLAITHLVQGFTRGRARGCAEISLTSIARLTKRRSHNLPRVIRSLIKKGLLKYTRRKAGTNGSATSRYEIVFMAPQYHGDTTPSIPVILPQYHGDTTPGSTAVSPGYYYETEEPKEKRARGRALPAAPPPPPPPPGANDSSSTTDSLRFEGDVPPELLSQLAAWNWSEDQVRNTLHIYSIETLASTASTIHRKHPRNPGAALSLALLRTQVNPNGKHQNCGPLTELPQDAQKARKAPTYQNHKENATRTP